MSRRTTRRRGAAIGLVSAGLALGVGEVTAAFARPDAAPAIAVGNRMIRLTPEPVKRWAIRTFGTNDKLALLIGIYVLVAVFAVGIGVLAARRLWAGLAGVALLGELGTYCALTAPASRGADVWPTLAGTVAAGAAMVSLGHLTGPDLPRDRPAGPLDRRRFMIGAAATGALAVAGGYVGRVLQGTWCDVSAARARVTLPAPVEPAAGAAGTGAEGAGPWQTSNGSFYCQRRSNFDPLSPVEN